MILRVASFLEPLLTLPIGLLLIPGLWVLGIWLWREVVEVIGILAMEIRLDQKLQLVGI